MEHDEDLFICAECKRAFLSAVVRDAHACHDREDPYYYERMREQIEQRKRDKDWLDYWRYKP